MRCYDYFEIRRAFMSKKYTDHECRDIKKNIDKYREMKGIENTKALLKMIGAELGDRDLDTFYDKEKSNFSSMINGNRPLKFEFIQPLERILGVSIARLYDEESYLLPNDKDEIPFIKGFRYYAYKDDMNLYLNEFSETMISGDGSPVILNTDEYNKSFLDYVIEYKSLNALRYLIKEHSLTPVYSGSFNTFFIDREYRISCHDPHGVLKMVIKEDDVELFNTIFDPVNALWIRNKELESARIDDEMIELIFNSIKIFDSLFETKKYWVKEFDRNVYGRDNDKVEVLSPFVNICLDYAIKHDRYKKRAIEILEFGIKHNTKIIESTHKKAGDLYIISDGRLYVRGDYVLMGVLVNPSNREPRDIDIKKLIDQLPPMRVI